MALYETPNNTLHPGSDGTDSNDGDGATNGGLTHADCSECDRRKDPNYRQAGSPGERDSIDRSRPAARDLYYVSLRGPAQWPGTSGADAANPAGRLEDDCL